MKHELGEREVIIACQNVSCKSFGVTEHTGKQQ